MSAPKAAILRALPDADVRISEENFAYARLSNDARVEVQFCGGSERAWVGRFHPDDFPHKGYGDTPAEALAAVLDATSRGLEKDAAFYADARAALCGAGDAPFVGALGGARFDLLAPSPSDVDTWTVGWALAHIIRFNGHASIRGTPWSVAHHSLAVAVLVDAWGGGQADVLYALVHDAHEAYIGDVVSPVKALLGPRWGALEGRVERAVLEAFGAEKSDLVKRADRAVTRAEGAWAWIGGFEGADEGTATQAALAVRDALPDGGVLVAKAWTEAVEKTLS